MNHGFGKVGSEDDVLVDLYYLRVLGRKTTFLREDTASLLEDDAYPMKDGTNPAMSVRAGSNIRTLHRYFPLQQP